MAPRLLAGFVLLAAIAVLRAEPPLPPAPGKPAEDILKRYLAAVEAQRALLRNVTMEVDIEAQIPSLNKSGRLTALRRISKVGQVTYQVVSFMGDNMIKKDVIARYISAEVKSSTNGEAESLAINADNYKFRYRGMYGEGDWRLHLFEVKPRKKRPGLFEGWVWIDDKTALPVRESGRFVKSPSVFLRRIEFVRDYRIRDGVALPVRIESEILTRLVGTAKISIAFTGVSFDGAQAARPAETAALLR